MKGYELLKEIAKGKVKNGSRIVVKTLYDSEITYWFWGNWFGQEDGYSKPMDNIELYLCSNENDFEIIQDEPDEIEELEIGTITTDERLKINELIRKVNEINRKLEEK